MRLQVLDDLSTVEFVSTGVSPRGPGRQLEAGAAAAWLRGWCRRHSLHERGTLQRLTAELRPSVAGAGDLSNDSLRASVERGLFSGQLRAFSFPTSVRPALQPASASAIAEHVPFEPDRSGWIEIVMVDAEGHPVPYLPYKIALENGIVLTGRLDSQGFARLEKLEPGSCDVGFPTLDAPDWVSLK